MSRTTSWLQFPTGDQYKQFFQLYEDGRYQQKPIFVTTDSVLHVYHLIFDKLLRSRRQISDRRSEEPDHGACQGDAGAVRRGEGHGGRGRRRSGTWAYFSVAAKLIDPSFSVPAAVQTEVNTDLAQIAAHASIGASAVMGIDGSDVYLEDFTQYVPRGHYTRSDELKRYFSTMMWFGRMTFRLKSVDETRSALLLTQALQNAKAGDRMRQRCGR